MVYLLYIALMSFSEAKQFNLHFEYDVKVSVPSDEGLKNSQNFERGSPVSIDSAKPYWIESRGRVPVMIVPVSHSLEENLKLDLPEVSKWPAQEVEKEIDRTLESLMDLITRFQIALSDKDLKEAEGLLTQMKSISNFPALNFLNAYLDYARGNFASAKVNLKEGLNRYPAHTQGQILLKNLEGGKND